MNKRTQQTKPVVAAPQVKQNHFELSNSELRLAINETHRAIIELYNGEHKTALTNHLKALLDIELSRAKLIKAME